ncbi:hypothetical protein [Paenibacillus spongiae]|uniref:CdiI immunity protein domain-containing protein n=1 Tax=Paenibacillus spongiae TaxID=2909671 RepID=A0ABY5S1U0_9BACL|nr:hypothetical protein [Paenibacillus spongiae]UVI27413.1 hypothetical protein L1F29_18250 [Paenibacillus spongiae]
MVEKYPENYFEHFIFCLKTTNKQQNEEGFTELAKLYIEIEGIDVFSELIKEIQLIGANNDWGYFEKTAQEYELDNMDLENIKKLAEIASKIYST